MAPESRMAQRLMVAASVLIVFRRAAAARAYRVAGTGFVTHGFAALRAELRAGYERGGSVKITSLLILILSSAPNRQKGCWYW